MLRGRLPRRCCPTRGYRLEARQKCLGLHSKGFSITWQGSRPYSTMKAGIKVVAGCSAPSRKESGVPNETTPVHICRHGDGKAIRAVGRGVPPSRLPTTRPPAWKAAILAAHHPPPTTHHPPTHQLATTHHPLTTTSQNLHPRFHSPCRFDILISLGFEKRSNRAQ